MAMKIFWLILTFTLTASWCPGAESGKILLEDSDLSKLKVEITEYLDLVLASLRTHLVNNGHERFALPNATRSFSKNFLGITWQGEASAYNGYLNGIQSVHRTGAAHVNVTKEGIIFSADIGFNRLYVGYDLKAKFMGLGPQARIDGSVDGIQCFLKGKTDLKKIEVAEVKLHNIGEFSLDVNGLGPVLDSLSASIAERFGNEIKDSVAQLVEEIIKDKLNNIDANTVAPLILHESNLA